MEAYDNGILTVTYEGKNSREVLRRYLLSIPSGRIKSAIIRIYGFGAWGELEIHFTQEFIDEIEKYNQRNRIEL